MDHRNERAPGPGRWGDLRVPTDDTHHTPDRPQGKTSDRARALLTALRAEYPVFREYLPLAIGIRVAVYAAAPGVTRETINCALAMHCRCDNYLKAIAAGGSRYALDGTPSGEVSEEHRTAAVLVLARRSEKASAPRSRP